MPKRPQDFPVLTARYPKTWSRVYPEGNHINHYTINDNSIATACCWRWRRTGDRQTEYLQAARRGGEFILRAQMPEPQPVWAQQYNASMEPVRARKFELPGLRRRKRGSCRTLIEVSATATPNTRTP